MKIESLNIPDKFVAFSKAIAALAESHGIKEFTLAIKPDWRDFPSDSGVSVNGNLSVYYASVDGRGRPSTKLHITLESRLIHQVVNEPDSFN